MGTLECVALAWALGTAVQLQQEVLWSGSAYAQGCALSVLGLLAVRGLLPSGVAAEPISSSWKRQGIAYGSILSACAGLMLCAVLAWASTGWRASIRSGDQLHPALEGQTLSVRGVIVGLPHRNEQGVRFRLEVEQGWSAGAAVQLPEQLDLAWWSGPVRQAAQPDKVDIWPQVPQLVAGDRWELPVRLKAVHGQANPHGFDLELWMWEQQIGATGSVRLTQDKLGPRWLGDSGQNRWSRWRQGLRDRLLQTVVPTGMDKALQVVAALLVGDQSAIERPQWELYRQTGVAHLMSISGLHITLFAWLAGHAMKALWCRSARLCQACPATVAAAVAGVALATAYAVFSGWGLPAQRTVWMLLAFQGLRLSARRWPARRIWLLALWVVLLLDPWALTQAGFWLSFVAVGVLMTQTPTVADTEVLSTRQRLWRKLRELIREQCLISLALTPLSLVLFQQVSVCGLLANLVAIPWVTLVVTPLAFGGLFWSGLWTAATWAVQGLHALLIPLSQLPGAVWSHAACPWPMAAAGVLGGLLCALRCPTPWRLLGLSWLLPMLLYRPDPPAAGQYEVWVLDVGQGTAVVLRTHTHTLLYDSGPRYGPDSDAGHRVLLPFLRAHGLQPDLMVLSHRDTDHTGGMPALLAAFPGLKVMSSMPTPRPGLNWQACQSGQQWEWDSVRLAMLHPPASDLDRPLKPNALSCVLRVQPQGDDAAGVMLLTGDIEAAQEDMLLKTSPKQLRADVLLVPHHGSKTSSTENFIRAVSPRVALVQAGYRNRFGHPTEAVSQRYAQFLVTLRRTDQCGAWHWRSEENPDAPNLCERMSHPRYWHPLTPIQIKDKS